MEWVSPGVASQTPVSTFSPFEASWAQVLKDGLPEMSRSGSGKAFFGAKSGLVSMVTRSDMAFFLSVAACSIDKADRILPGAVAPDVFYDRYCRRMRLRHGRDMRRDDHLRMRPEWMAFRQRLGIGDVEHGCCQLPAVERLDERVLNELRAAADMQQPRSRRQKREKLCVQDSPCLLRQGEEADENIGCRQKAAKLVVAMKAGDALDLLLAAAPCGKGKPKRPQAIDGSLRQHPETKEADAPIGRLGRCKSSPMAASLLLPIAEHLAMERQHAEDDVFLHHADDAVLDHAHELHPLGYGVRAELVDTRADGEEHLQIAKARDIVRHVPGQQVAYLFWVDGFATMIEFLIGKLARKRFAEDGPPGRIRIEKKGHRCTLRVHAASRARGSSIILGHEKAPLHPRSRADETSMASFGMSPPKKANSLARSFFALM